MYPLLKPIKIARIQIKSKTPYSPANFDHPGLFWPIPVRKQMDRDEGRGYLEPPATPIQARAAHLRGREPRQRPRARRRIWRRVVARIRRALDPSRRVNAHPAPCPALSICPTGRKTAPSPPI